MTKNREDMLKASTQLALNWTKIKISAYVFYSVVG